MHRYSINDAYFFRPQLLSTFIPFAEISIAFTSISITLTISMPMSAQFRMSLSKALSEATGHFDIVTSDTRIGPLLKVLVAATMQ